MIASIVPFRKEACMVLLKKIFLIIVLLIVLSIKPPTCYAQDIPVPTGRFAIGHQRFEWTDSSRSEILAANNGKRQVVADVWYPGVPSDKAPTAYLDTLPINRAFGEKGLRSLLGVQGAALVRSTGVHTHAYENARFADRLQPAPVIFFSHGMGMITQLYTTQIEDLVSHGYIVVALSHPYDAWIVPFSDGSQVLFETKHRKAAGNTEEQHITYENKRVEWWAADIRFALNQLMVMNKRKDSAVRFAGHMDLGKVGAMGHSIGGRAAARACQLDARLKSCADQDGVANMQPFFLNPDGSGMKQRFLLFERDRNATLSETDAASMNMTLAELNALVTRFRNAKEAALAATGGSYKVLLRFDSSSHMSFSDLPLLQAKDRTEVAAAKRVLEVTCRYTREFFDMTLRRIQAPLYQTNKRLNYIDLVKRYPSKGDMLRN